MRFGPYDRSFFELDEEGCGIEWDEFMRALSVWAWMRASNGRSTSVRFAAEEFNVTDQTVLAAVDAHPWMLLSGPGDDPTKQLIEHDGL